MNGITRDEAIKQINELQKIANPERVSLGEYKGNPTINFNGNHAPFGFGLSKARTIIANFEAIKKFVTDFEK